ncbi:AAA family ATPase [Microbacterium sp. MMO-10]|uniref:AAA family ATPase n=1 Tax=Microbacterium sp. MMO-10 TaxID=3081272 RepID=UPI00301A704C
MKLINFTVEGYRRFLLRTSVKLHSDLIAFVGPNEAGKSSLLKALKHLNHDEPFDRTEYPRRSSGVSPTLQWQLQLEADDVEALAHLRDGAKVEKIVVRKIGVVGRSIEFHPVAPSRDPNPRLALAAELKRSKPILEYMATYLPIDLSPVDAIITSMASGEAPPEPTNLDWLAEYAEAAANVLESGNIDAAAFPGEAWTDWAPMLRDLVVQTRQQAQAEAEPDPTAAATAILLPRLPELRLLEPEDRDLKSEYDLESEADHPSAALGHLARLADLDLIALRQEVRDGNYADVATRRNKANDRLRKIFEESWNQQDVAVQVDVQNAFLFIQVTTPSDEGLSSITERSDGLRWFAALLAFTHGGRNKPILLADEIETHLHYDAQADLVDVLGRQVYTSKVLYTTHSFGCLPNDLGNGVRVVEPINQGTSRLRNGFWEGGAGFSPLLKSMGAAAATFTPARHALIGEGPCEAILLPTLFRQAAMRDKLGFQVVPGLSSVAGSQIPELVSQAGHVAFVVDGDGGGLDNRDKLVAAGVGLDHVIVLDDTDGAGALEIEDLVAPEIYAACVSKEARCWATIPGDLAPENLPAGMRTKAVAEWATSIGIDPPDKVAVAQRVANQSVDRDIVDPGKRELVRAILERIESALEL